MSLFITPLNCVNASLKIVLVHSGQLCMKQWNAGFRYICLVCIWHHWNLRVVMMPALFSQAVLQVVLMTTMVLPLMTKLASQQVTLHMLLYYIIYHMKYVKFMLYFVMAISSIINGFMWTIYSYSIRFFTLTGDIIWLPEFWWSNLERNW